MDKGEKEIISEDNTVNRRRFLAAAGVGIN